MQDSGQNGDAMHKGIMLSGQTVDNAADSVPESDNMSYVNQGWRYQFSYDNTTHASLGSSVRIFRHPSTQSPADQPDPSCPHTAPINAPQANSTPLAATLENK